MTTSGNPAGHGTEGPPGINYWLLMQDGLQDGGHHHYGVAGNSASACNMKASILKSPGWLL